MKQITKLEFLEGYEQGFIVDVVAIQNRVYGKDPRGMFEEPKMYEVVYFEF